MGTKDDLKINAIENSEFSTFLLEKHQKLRYGYPNNLTLDIMDKAFTHAKQDNTFNNYYDITINGVVVAMIAMTCQDDYIIIPYLFILVPYIINYKKVLSQFLSVEGKLSGYKHINIDSSGIVVAISNKADFAKVEEMGFIIKTALLFTLKNLYPRLKIQER
ncbi:MAG: hypothetical protein GY710_19535 [Desulfobacteraceae bacterium]|nr:hypothetical protein [Desulfobacteraceae bacterium]